MLRIPALRSLSFDSSRKRAARPMPEGKQQDHNSNVVARQMIAFPAAAGKQNPAYRFAVM